MPKLNVWKRLGIVLSIIWIVGAGGYEYLTEDHRAGDWADFARQTCEETRSVNNITTPDNCDDEFVKQYEMDSKGEWGDAAITAIIPLVFFWLLAWAIIGVARWVMRGRDVAD